MKIYIRILSIQLFIAFLCFGCNRLAPLPDVTVTKEKVAAIVKLMDRFYENEQFYGTILIAVKGEIIYQHATGYADRDSLIPNTLDTKFRIASATKPMTAMLVLQLVEEGKLRLDDKVTDILPEYPADKGRDITIHHLLTHRSGIVGEPRVRELERIEKLYHSREQMLDLITGFDLVFEPGTRNEYSNFGYYMLGVIIERVSGKSYDELLQEKICAPIGMENTLPDVTGVTYEKRAIGYHYNYFTGPELAPHLDMSFAFGCGHLLSNTQDLYRFDQALYGDVLLKDEELMHSFFDNIGWRSQKVPIGNERRKIRVGLVNASVNGFKCNMMRIADEKIFITQLTNHKEQNQHILQGYGTSDIASRILAILYDQPYDLPRKSAAYEVFRSLVDSGETAAREKYFDLNEYQQDKFWFKDEEFVILTRELYNASMFDKALVYCKLAPDNSDISALITEIQEHAK